MGNLTIWDLLANSTGMAPGLGSAAGGIAGGLLGMAGGPLAPLTVPVAASLGAAAGGALGGVAKFGGDLYSSEENKHRTDVEIAAQQEAARQQEIEAEKIARRQASLALINHFL